MFKLAKLGVCASSAVLLSVGAWAPMAHADPAPVGTNANNGDIVGVGSDTVQYGDDFIADGSGTTSGYNFFNPSHRIASFDATNSLILNTGKLTQLTGDLVKLRGAGGTGATNIIARPNGSGAGLKLICPSGNTCNGGASANNAKIDFARSSSALDTASSAVLDAHPFATDTIQVAVNNTPLSSGSTKTNAPTTLTTDVLRRIYESTSASDSITTWGQVPGYSGPAPSDKIVPLLPQASSGTGKTFLSDIFNKSVPSTLNSNIVITEEHDPSFFINPTSFTNPATNATFSAGQQIDAIGPFSGARVSLYNQGYFNYLNASYANAVSLLAGQGTGSADSYQNTRQLLNVTRQSARGSAFETAAFSASGFFCGDTGQALAQAAGLGTLSVANGCGGDN